MRAQDRRGDVRACRRVRRNHCLPRPRETVASARFITGPAVFTTLPAVFTTLPAERVPRTRSEGWARSYRTDARDASPSPAAVCVRTRANNDFYVLTERASRRADTLRSRARVREYIRIHAAVIYSVASDRNARGEKKKHKKIKQKPVRTSSVGGIATRPRRRR